MKNIKNKFSNIFKITFLMLAFSTLSNNSALKPRMMNLKPRMMNLDPIKTVSMKPYTYYKNNSNENIEQIRKNCTNRTILYNFKKIVPNIKKESGNNEIYKQLKGNQLYKKRGINFNYIENKISKDPVLLNFQSDQKKYKNNITYIGPKNEQNKENMENNLKSESNLKESKESKDIKKMNMKIENKKEKFKKEKIKKDELNKKNNKDKIKSSEYIIDEKKGLKCKEIKSELEMIKELLEKQKQCMPSTHIKNTNSSLSNNAKNKINQHNNNIIIKKKLKSKPSEGESTIKIIPMSRFMCNDVYLGDASDKYEKNQKNEVKNIEELIQGYKLIKDNENTNKIKEFFENHKDENLEIAKKYFININTEPKEQKEEQKAKSKLNVAKVIKLGNRFSKREKK